MEQLSTIKRWFAKLVSFVKLLEDMAGMMSTNTHLKRVLGFRGVYDTDILFIVEILHDVQKGSGSTLISFLSKCLQYIQPVVTLCICVPISDAIIQKNFLIGNLLFWFWIFPHFYQKSCFCCALCSNFTTLYLLTLKKTVQRPLRKGR